MSMIRVGMALPAIVMLLACTLPSADGHRARNSLRTVDGLERVEIPLPGVLDLRENHRIGSYDGLLIREPDLSYDRHSLRLTREAREVFLRLLRDSLVDASRAATIAIHDQPGPCVMEIDLAVFGLNLDVGEEADALAKMTLVMQFRDSESREPLLRYATQNLVPIPEIGVSHDRQLREGLDQIIRDMDFAAAFRVSGYADDEIKPGCEGTLAALGRAAAARRSAVEADR